MKASLHTGFPRALVAVILIALCALSIRSAWRTGIGRLLARYAGSAILREQADRAVGMSPIDPETHSARAFVLYNLKEMRATLDELERAVTLRPRHYLLWLQLGRAREEAGDKEGALLAMQEAIRLAPYYAEPRWQYGNVLYRMGRFEEAFEEMRRAAESDPSRSPVLIDLAWGSFQGNAQAVERVVRPQTGASRLALARFFIKHEKIDEAMALVRASNGISDEERKALLTALIKSRAFKAAYEVWAVGDRSNKAVGGTAGITDAGFEGRISLSDTGFGWRQERELDAVKLSVDTKEALSGSRSLLIEWKGKSNPSVPVVSQFVLVEPNARYRLTFFARTQELVTAAPPIVQVADASAADARVLAQSEPLAEASADWRKYEVEFRTQSGTEAVLISIQRQSCVDDPCPIFGSTWLDDFSLQKF